MLEILLPIALAQGCALAQEPDPQDTRGAEVAPVEKKQSTPGYARRHGIEHAAVEDLGCLDRSGWCSYCSKCGTGRH